MTPPKRKRGAPMTPLRQNRKREPVPPDDQREGLEPVLLRLKRADKALIEKAAALSQLTPTAFLEQHALEAARRIIKEKETGTAG